MLIICFSISIIYIYNIENVGDVYKKYAKGSIIDIKKSFLKDNVNNVISDIEKKQELESQYYKKLTEDSSKILQQYYQISPNSFLYLCTKYFEVEYNKDAFCVLILDKESNKIVYERDFSNSNNNVDYSERLRLMKNNLSSYSQGSYGKYDVFWGVSKDYIDNSVNTTISMGVSYFENSDQDSSFSIKRADIALYNAKNKEKIKLACKNIS